MTYKGIAAEVMPEYDDSYLNPESDEAEVCMIGRERQARLSRQGRPVGPRSPGRRP